MKKFTGLLMIFMLIFLLSSCGNNQNSESNTQNEPQENTEVPNEETVELDNNEVLEEESKDDDMVEEEVMEAEMKEFNAEELSKYNGKDGNPAYVAYEGKVYDVSEIRAWKDGVHQGKLEAGKDHTDILNNKAPHPPTNLTNNAPVVGSYKE
jgi:predicted heme/steroid binding protein